MLGQDLVVIKSILDLSRVRACQGSPASVNSITYYPEMTPSQVLPSVDGGADLETLKWRLYSSCQNDLFIFGPSTRHGPLVHDLTRNLVNSYQTYYSAISYNGVPVGVLAYPGMYFGCSVRSPKPSGVNISTCRTSPATHKCQCIYASLELWSFNTLYPR